MHGVVDVFVGAPIQDAVVLFGSQFSIGTPTLLD